MRPQVICPRRRGNLPSNASDSEEARHATKDQGHDALGREPSGQRRNGLVLTRQVEVVLGVAGGVAGGGDAVGRAVVQKVLGHGEALLDLEGRLDKGHGQARVHVPLDVAVEEPDARVVRLEAQDKVARGRHDDGVAAHGHRREVGHVAGVPVARVVVAAVDDLERVPVQVEGVLARVVVV